jgi:hypothetical protein
MRFQATNLPSAEHDGETITVSVPSGGSAIEITLTCDQALALVYRTKGAACAMLEEVRHRPTATVLPFKRPKRKAA